MEEPTLTPGRWTPARKAAVVLAWLRGWNPEEMPHFHGLSQARLEAWRNRFLAGGQAALTARYTTPDQACERRVRQLERKIHRLTVENQKLKTRAPSRQMQPGRGAESVARASGG